MMSPHKPLAVPPTSGDPLQSVVKKHLASKPSHQAKALKPETAVPPAKGKRLKPAAMQVARLLKVANKRRQLMAQVGLQ